MSRISPVRVVSSASKKVVPCFKPISKALLPSASFAKMFPLSSARTAAESVARFFTATSKGVSPA